MSDNLFYRAYKQSMKDADHYEKKADGYKRHKAIETALRVEILHLRAAIKSLEIIVNDDS